MRIERHAYSCDACQRVSREPGFATDAEAWSHAKRAGWTRTELPIDGTGHVGVAHFCPAHAPVPRVVTFTG